MRPLFIDRDLGGKRLARALRAVGVAVTPHIERYASADAETVADIDWIAEAARRDEVIVTRDGTIRRRDVEIAAIIRGRARCVVLETGNASALVYLRALLVAWPELERICDDEAPPFVYGINRDGRLTRRHP